MMDKPSTGKNRKCNKEIFLYNEQFQVVLHSSDCRVVISGNASTTVTIDGT